MQSCNLQRLAILVLLGALPVLASACGNGTPGDDGGASNGVSMNVQPNVAEAGDELDLTISNETGSTVSYGAAFELEREVDGGWEEVELDLAFIEILLTLEAGESSTEPVPLPDDLEPGTYRVAKAFSLEAEGDAGERPERARPTAEIEVVS